MASCYSCFMINVLQAFCVVTVARERSRLVPLKAIPMGRTTPLANAVLEIVPVNNVDVIGPVSTMPVILLNRFTFFVIRSRTQFHEANRPKFQLIF